MARKSKRSKSKKSRVKRVRHNTSFFKPGDAKTIEQFLIASMVQGAFTAAGAVIGTILAKYVLTEVEKTGVPLPKSLYAIIDKEAAAAPT